MSLQTPPTLALKPNKLENVYSSLTVLDKLAFVACVSVYVISSLIAELLKQGRITANFIIGEGRGRVV